MFIDWKPGEGRLEVLKSRIGERAAAYRSEYGSYYSAACDFGLPEAARFESFGRDHSRARLFGFGKNKKEARITTEFFINAIHVMAGANALEEGSARHPYPQARLAEQSSQFASFRNYVALPRSEAFRIEYWALEEAKLQRMPAEAEFSRKILLVIGGGSGIGREVALLLARKGAHTWLWRIFDEAGAAKVAEESAALSIY